MRRILGFFNCLLLAILCACAGDASPNVVVNLKDATGIVVETKTISLEEGKAITCFDLLDANFDVEAELSTYGHFIKRINDLVPLDSTYWVSFDVNGSTSAVGADFVVPQEDDVYDFYLTSSKSARDIRIDALIYDYLPTVNNQLCASSIDIDVLASVALLEEYGYSIGVDDYLNADEVSSYYASNAKSYLERIIAKRCFGISIDTETTALEESVSESWQAINDLAALMLANSESAAIEEYVTVLNTTNEYVDFYAMALYALAGTGASYLSFFIDEVEAYLSDSNDCNTNSIAMGIIGLLANNEADIVSDAIDTLLEFEVDGLFTFAGEKNAYATKQAYAALITYKVWNDQWNKAAVNLYR